MTEQAQFRIGAFYLSQGGDVMKVTGLFKAMSSNSPHKFTVSRIGIKSGKNYEDDGARYADGSYFGVPSDEASLLPGEVIERDGQWVLADPSIHFPSGSVVLTDGNQITGRIEPEAIAAANLAKQIDNEVMESLRAPLPHFNQRTEFDPFPGFKVRSDTGWMTGEDGHPLQRMTADSPTHGSAHLLAKP